VLLLQRDTERPFLSTSSRSTDCRHTRQLQSALTAAAVTVDKFRSRMRLHADASDFAGCSAFGGSLVWTVLYRSVFSVVSFTAANAATCIAPCCRRFRGRCGHVQVAREHLKRVGVTGHSGLPPGVNKDVKQVPAERSRVRHLRSEDEDEGLEKVPSDTLRVDGDSDPSKIGARHDRNMLPCGGEIKRGEAWNRTADWQRLFDRRSGRSGAEPTNEGKLLQVLFESASTRDMLINPEETLVDPLCGSCGLRRQDRHEIVKEPGLLHTHHPTAPPIEVRVALGIRFPPGVARFLHAHCYSRCGWT